MPDDSAMEQYEEKVKSMNLLPFKLGYLPDSMVTKAKEELGETQETKAKAITELRGLLEQETNLYCSLDDDYLLQYLRARKFNVKKTFQLMQSYFHIKKDFKDVYGAFDPEMLRKYYATGEGYVLPYRDSDGCAIHIWQICKWDPDVFTLAEATLALTTNVLYSIEDPATQVCGIRVLYDVKGFSLKQIRCITPRMLYLYAKAFNSCLPLRFKSLHIYNASAVFHHIWKIVRLFLSEKIGKRIYFHGDNQKEIHEAIPKIILPAEFGGDYPLDPCDWFNVEIQQYLEKAKERLTYGYRN